MKKQSIQSKQKKSNNSSIKSKLIMLLICVIAYILYSLLFKTDENEPTTTITEVDTQEQTEPQSTPEPKPEKKEKKQKNSNKKTSRTDNNQYGLMMMPVTNADLKEEIINHIGYSTSYNCDRSIPNWVIYVLTKSELKSVCEREGDFVSDPNAHGKKPTTRDYTGSGYDRGHMAPAADMKWSEQAMNESFYLSNVCPQSGKLNRGRWLNLENKVRDWARLYDSVMVVCGPIFTKKRAKTIGQNEISVPDAFFKIVARIDSDNKYQMLGFIFPNANCPKDIFDYTTTVDSIENVTGHDFFECLPDNIETQLESELITTNWQ